MNHCCWLVLAPDAKPAAAAADAATDPGTEEEDDDDDDEDDDELSSAYREKSMWSDSTVLFSCTGMSQSAHATCA